MDPRFSSLIHQSAGQDCTESSGYIPSAPGGRLPDVLREGSLGFKGLDRLPAEMVEPLHAFEEDIVVAWRRRHGHCRALMPFLKARTHPFPKLRQRLLPCPPLLPQKRRGNLS